MINYQIVKAYGYKLSLLFVLWTLVLIPVCMAGSVEKKIDSEAIVEAHNKWRSRVGVPDLQWSPELARMARQWANTLKTRNCRLEHSGREGYGENIFRASAVIWSDGRREIQEITPEKVVDSWGSEVKNYNYETDTCSGVCGHYTQIVWEETRKVGCGMAVCEDKSQVWVCNYYPPGNYVGKKPY